jgi:hypothetical protein
MGSRYRVRSVILASVGVLAAGASFALAAPSALAQDGGLKELRDRVEAQQREIDDLKSRMSGGGGGSADSGSIADYLKKGIPTKKGTSFIKFYGMLRLDGIWDDSTPSNTQTIGWVKSEDPTAAGGVKKNQSDLTIHPRLTRFGFDLDGGRVAAMNDAALTGKVEIDFYNSGLSGQSESRAAIRMRHAYMNFDWGSDVLLAGQTNDLISPLYPIVNNDLVMWGAGNLGDRRPQVRFTHSMAAGGEGRLTLAGMAGLTGAVDNQNLDGNGLRDGEASGYPTLQARIGWSFPWQKAKGEVGVWAHNASEVTSTDVGTHHRFESSAYGFDVNLPLTESLYLKGEGWKGRNLDDVRGGIFQGVNAAGNEIGAQGGWVEAGFKVSRTVTLAAGVTEDNPTGSDLAAGGKDKNRVYYVAVHFNWDPVELGIDFMHWHTEFVGQASGLDNRIQVYISYSF